MDFGQVSLINGAMRSIYGAESFPLICIPNYDQMKSTPRWIMYSSIQSEINKTLKSNLNSKYMWPSGLMGSDFIWWFISIIIFNLILVQYISSVQLKFHQAAQWLRVQDPIPTQVLQLTNTIRLGRASEFLSLSKLRTYLPSITVFLYLRE